MSLQMLYGIVGAALLGLSAAATAHEKGQLAATPPPPKSVSAPAAAVDAFGAAISKGDEASAKKLLAENVLIYESGGQESSRDEYAAQHLKGDMAFLAGLKQEVLSRAEGGDDAHAWVSTRSRIAGRHKGKDVDVLSTETMVLSNTAEGWRIVHIHWSSRPAGH